MRDQYAGDVSDLLKFAFLRTLAADERTVGVGWYYNPAPDGRFDGGHREYCDEPKWESLDSPLLSALRKLPERSVSALEKLPIWPPNTSFHRIPVPCKGNRLAWTIEMKGALQEASIVFLDPDNGVGGVSERHTTLEEIAVMRQPGRVVVLIKFPGRSESYDEQIEEYHAMLRPYSAVSLVTVRTCVSVRVVNNKGCLQMVPRARWFTIVDADDTLIERAEQFAHKLSRIENCKADVVYGSQSKEISGESRVSVITVQSPRQPRATNRNRTVENVCPECGRQFKGNGFDGIDAHWRARHESTMPYKEAWPLVKSGNYHRKVLPQERA